MKNLILRLFFVVLVWGALFVYIFPWSSYSIDVPFSWKDYKLGLDLQWWIELDYKIDLTEASEEEDYDINREKEIIEWLKSIIDKRIESLNISDSSIFSARYGGEKHIIVQIPLKGSNEAQDKENIEKAKAAIGKVVKIEFKERWEDGGWIRAFDEEGRYLSDKYFVKSSVQFDEAFQPLVELTFNSEWAKIFGDLTERLVWQPIAIFVGGELLTSPNVNEPIYGGKAIITGQYSVQEAKKLSNDINTWVVPAPIYLTSEKAIDPKLGASSLSKLIFAWVSGFFIIFVFLLSVYRLSGFMASIALFSYVILVLTVIKSFWITLTLASIAGLILSIGMAIDANILIFERIKDELNVGKKFEEASKVWFSKSWSAIWDSNVTGFIVALILFVFGINLIKWFGLMLAIWILASLFSAMWISRVLVILTANVSKKRSHFIGK